MTGYHSLNRHSKQTLENINTFIDGEGLKRKRIANKLGMSESNFSDYLNGKRSNILDFAVRLAVVLGLEETYFMNPEFVFHPKESEDRRKNVFSAVTLSKEGEEGLNQLLRICELIETYNKVGTVLVYHWKMMNENRPYFSNPDNKIQDVNIFF